MAGQKISGKKRGLFILRIYFASTIFSLAIFPRYLFRAPAGYRIILTLDNKFLQILSREVCIIFLSRFLPNCIEVPTLRFSSFKSTASCLNDADIMHHEFLYTRRIHARAQEKRERTRAHAHT